MKHRRREGRWVTVIGLGWESEGGGASPSTATRAERSRRGDRAESMRSCEEGGRRFLVGYGPKRCCPPDPIEHVTQHWMRQQSTKLRS